MKRILSIISASLLFCSFSFSQMNTGSYFVSGNTNMNFGLGSSKEIDVDFYKSTLTSFGLTPKVGYFIKNRIAVGGLMNISIDREKVKFTDSGGDENITKYTTTEWYIGPFGRYYVEYGKLIPFAEVSVAFGGAKDKTETEESTEELPHSVFIVSGGIGASYFLTESFALEGLLQYSYDKRKPTWEDATGKGHVISGVNFLIGVAVYFGKI
jgi:hypothetical protein